MHGIVLWVNQKSKLALIWCEDHKGLATYSGPDPKPATISLDSGDLVEFDVVNAGEFRERKAINLRVSTPKLATDLPEQMAKVAPRPKVKLQSSAEFGQAKVELTKR